MEKIQVDLTYATYKYTHAVFRKGNRIVYVTTVPTDAGWLATIKKIRQAHFQLVWRLKKSGQLPNNYISRKIVGKRTVQTVFEENEKSL